MSISENQHENSIGESRFFHIGDFLGLVDRLN
jgi:hypothetical protein